ncbi:thioredoxin TrxA [Candidatus Gillettellia adelgis]
MKDKVIHLTDENFNSNVIKAKELILVDFWAEWCGPCKTISLILDEISKEFPEKLTIAKLNIEQHAEIAAHYGIRSIPTLLLFKDGTVVATKVGTLTKGQLKDFINANL